MFEVGGQIEVRLDDPGPDDEGEPPRPPGVQARCGQHARVGHHNHVGDAVPLRERLERGDEGLGLGLVALEQLDLKREARRVEQQPDLDLGGLFAIEGVVVL